MPISKFWAPLTLCALVASSGSGSQAAQRPAKATKASAKSKSAGAAPRKATPKKRVAKAPFYGVRQVDGVMILSGGGSLSLPSRPASGSLTYRTYPQTPRGSYASAGSPSVGSSATRVAVSAMAPVQARQKVFPQPFEAVDTRGQKINLQQYAGKVVLLDFWATWCPPCRAEMPSLVALYGKQRSRGFDIIGISLDSQPEALSGFVRANGMGWRQIFGGKNWDSEIPKLYGVTSIPYTVLLDRDGSIIATGLRGAQLEQVVAQVLARR